MNLLLALYIPLFFTPVSGEYVMNEFHALKTEKQELTFVKKYLKVNDPSVQAYVIASQLKKAEYVFNPIKKIGIFNKYKEQLNGLIKKHPNNAHAHYVRLVVQERIPKILSSDELIRKDKLFLKKYLLSHKGSLVRYIKTNTSL